METLQKDRRRSKRFNVDWSVCLWHEPTQRFYSARSKNISTSGALVQLPLTVPIRLSEQLEVNFSVPKGQGIDETSSKVFSASVVRVNRGESLLDGHQSVAITFDQ